MHSYYKKLVEEREVKLGEKRIMGPVSKRYKINKLTIPDVALPLASFYRKNKFDIKAANPDEKYYPSLNLTFHNNRNDDLSTQEIPSMDVSFDQTFLTTKENFGPKLTRNLDTSVTYNPPQSVKNQRNYSKLPELSLFVLEENNRKESPQAKRSGVQMKPPRALDRSYMKDINIINPNSFKYTKDSLAEKYDRVPKRDIRKLTEKLEMNRARRSAKFRVGGLRFPTNESIENIKDDPLMPTIEKFGNFSPSALEKKAFETRYSSSPSRRPASTKMEFLPEKRKESFEEDRLATQIEHSFKAEEERLEKMGNWKKKKLTMGDKYELLHKINENFLVKEVNQHRSLLQSLLNVNR